MGKRRIVEVDTTLFGERYDVREFIQVDNPDIMDLANELKAITLEETVDNILSYVAREIRYPFDYKGKPSTAKKIKAFKWWGTVYLYSDYKEYTWLFPNQTIRVGYGICIDTANLTVSLLRLYKIPAWVVLGSIIRSRDGKFMGFHAWVEYHFNGCWVYESTVHPEPLVIPCEKAYNGELDILYDPFAWYNEKSYREDREKVRRYERIVGGETRFTKTHRERET